MLCVECLKTDPLQLADDSRHHAPRDLSRLSGRKSNVTVVRSLLLGLCAFGSIHAENLVCRKSTIEDLDIVD